MNDTGVVLVLATSLKRCCGIMMPMCTVSTCLGSRLRRFFTIDVRQDPKSCRNDINSEHRHAKVIKCRIIIVKRHRRIAISLLPTVLGIPTRDTYLRRAIIAHDLDLTSARASETLDFEARELFGSPRRPSIRSQPRHIIRHYLQLLER